MAPRPELRVVTDNSSGASGDLVDRILAAVVDRGTWHTRVASLGIDDLPAFRSRLRGAGRERGVRIRTHLVREGELLLVEWPEWEPTPLQEEATSLVIKHLGSDTPVHYDEALEQTKRRRITPA